MNSTTASTPLPDAERVFAYFLGELTAAESERFEAEVFQADDLAEQVFALEDELIELYLHDGLPPARRARFEQNYLTTAARHERVALAAALERQLKASSVVAPAVVEPPRAAWWRTFFVAPRLAWACLLLLVLSAGLWRLWRQRTPAPEDFAHNASPTPQVTPSAAPSSTPPIVTPTALPHVTPPARPALLATITLAPGLPRGGGQALPTLRLPTAATAAELTLQMLDATNADYRAVLQTEGAMVWTVRGLKARNKSDGTAEVRVRIPARQLKRGDYLLLLFDTTSSGAPVGDYSFRVLPE